MNKPPLIFLGLLGLMGAVVAWNELVPTRTETVEVSALEFVEEERVMRREKGPFPPGSAHAAKGRHRQVTVGEHYRATVIIDGSEREFAVAEDDLETVASAFAAGRPVRLTFKLKRAGILRVSSVESHLGY